MNEYDLSEEPHKNYNIVTLLAIFLVAAGLIATAWYIYNSYFIYNNIIFYDNDNLNFFKNL